MWSRSAWLALEGDTIALGNRQTLNALQDPERRPLVPREALPASIHQHIPQVEIDLEQDRFSANLRSARRGAARGPSGMTADHIKVVLESERDCISLWRMCQEFARGHIPAEILQVVRIGRMTALQKPQGGGAHLRTAIGMGSGATHVTSPIHSLN